ncbi:hypothetical protein EYF80_020279 [Liparis tanakae]|uniref:Uncharacterized protein n=1 Tax=Liparis tanakae TaxID=230148 RepID=A0A4Z2HVX4_9TELE|nr:hypothetical protein EYF80_020279 [Liparis tanakae]
MAVTAAALPAVQTDAHVRRAGLHLDLVLEEPVLAAQWNHTGPPQVQLVQLVQEGGGHHFKVCSSCAHKNKVFVVAVPTGTLKLTASAGTKRPAAKAVRCLVRHTALLALVSASGTMPSVRHCFSVSLKY